MPDLTFTQPIRLYKANDPYYFELDNVPLRQLEENILWLKSKIEGTDDDGSDGATTVLTNKSELNINLVRQLRAKALGGRTVQVNSGKFTARINDAFDIAKPLTELISAAVQPDIKVFPNIEQVWSEVDRDAVWNNFVGIASEEKAYNLNGLEVLYTIHSTPGGQGTSWAVNTNLNYPKYSNVVDFVAGHWPGFNVFSPVAGQGGLGTSNFATFATLPDVHMAFVKRWRSTFRTAVVDFPKTTLEIPAWEDNDFYRYDDEGVKQVLTGAGQRIDLLVAYSMPIDSSSAALQDYQDDFENNDIPSPRTISQPVLGLIKGAGLGIVKSTNSSPLSVEVTGGKDDPGIPGSKRLLANISDSEEGANRGITTDITNTRIHGSFPSPDDLLNLAPVLALDVEPDNFNLVGQTALPIAYVVVREGQNTLTQDDLIDIRPFLRTAELAYNERAGIGAANPPLSMANPAVGSFQLQDAVNKVVNKIPVLPTDVDDGTAIYTDYVMGGLAYGVEGTLLSMCENTGDLEPFGNNLPTTYIADDDNTYDFSDFTSPKAFLESTELLKKEAFLEYVYTSKQSECKRWISNPNTPFDQTQGTYLNLPLTEGRNLPLWPEWDMPMTEDSYDNLLFGDDGVGVPKVTWWMWFDAVSHGSSFSNGNRGLAFVPGGVVSNENTNSASHLTKFFGFGSKEEADASITIVSKTIEITLPTWVEDYDVNVEYVNCGPLTGFGHANFRSVGLGGGLNVNKGPILSNTDGSKVATFQINSAAHNLGGARENDNGITKESGKDSGALKDKIGKGGLGAPPRQKTIDKDYHFLSYSVALPQFKSAWNSGPQSLGTTDANLNRSTPKFGAAYYPTVKFSIVGYTQNPVIRNTQYSEENNYTLLSENDNLTGGSLKALTTNKPPLHGVTKPSKIKLN